MKRVYMPLFEDENEIEWTKEFLKILENIYPEEANVKIISRHGMIQLANNAPRLCFRHAVDFFLCN